MCIRCYKSTSLSQIGYHRSQVDTDTRRGAHGRGHEEECARTRGGVRAHTDAEDTRTSGCGSTVPGCPEWLRSAVSVYASSSPEKHAMQREGTREAVQGSAGPLHPRRPLFMSLRPPVPPLTVAHCHMHLPAAHNALSHDVRR